MKQHEDAHSQFLFRTVLEGLTCATRQEKNKKHADWKEETKLIIYANINPKNLQQGQCTKVIYISIHYQLTIKS